MPAFLKKSSNNNRAPRVALGIDGDEHDPVLRLVGVEREHETDRNGPIEGGSTMPTIGAISTAPPVARMQSRVSAVLRQAGPMFSNWRSSPESGDDVDLWERLSNPVRIS